MELRLNDGDHAVEFRGRKAEALAEQGAECARELRARQRKVTLDGCNMDSVQAAHLLEREFIEVVLSEIETLPDRQRFERER